MTQTLRWTVRAFTLLAAGVLAVPTSLPAQSTPAPGAPPREVEAFTQPFKRVELSFNGLGVVETVHVREGDRVTRGQVLMVQDDDLEVKEAERLKLEAESKARREFAQADLDVKRAVLERKQRIFDQGAGSDSEIEEARLQAIQSEKQIDIIAEELEAARIRYEAQRLRVEKTRLPSSVNGMVERIVVWEGEVIDPRDPAIVVVQNDPVLIEIRVLTTREVAQLALGTSIDVRYPDSDVWQQAKVSFIAPVADAASDTQLVKLEMPNPQQRATGLPIVVRLPAGLSQGREGVAMSPTPSR